MTSPFDWYPIRDQGEAWRYTIYMYIQHSLVYRLSDIFSVHEKRGGLRSNVMWQMLAWHHEREAVNNHQFQIRPPTSVYQTTIWGLQGSYYTRLKALASYLPSTSNWSAWKYGSPLHNFHNPPPFSTLEYGCKSRTWHCIPDSLSFLCTLNRWLHTIHHSN